MYRQSCKVLAVIPPEGTVVNGDASDENGEEGEKKKRYSGDKNISILHLSCRMSDLQFSLVLQTHVLVL